MQKIDIWTDGACSGNPGPGGWGALIRTGADERELSGAEDDTTNNRMELMAAICALESLPAPSAVRLHTDSKYLKDGITQWIKKWRMNGWKNANRKPVRNADLWERLDATQARHEIDWLWVKAHDGDVGNERADALARAAITQVRGY